MNHACARKNLRKIISHFFRRYSKIPVETRVHFLNSMFSDATPRACAPSALPAAHISSATRAPMIGVPVVSPTPATMERAKMVFIIWMRSLLVWLARNARPRALAGLQYTDDSLIYCARLQFFSPFFFSKRSKFRLSHQLF